MADSQIKNLTTRTLALADFIVSQGASGDAGKSTLTALKALIGKQYSALAGAITTGALGTPTILENDFGATTFTIANPSNALITVTASTAVFTADKTFMIGTSFVGGGVMYVVSGARSSDTVFNITITTHDNDRSGTPNFSNLFFEIRVYP